MLGTPTKDAKKRTVWSQGIPRDAKGKSREPMDPTTPLQKTRIAIFLRKIFVFCKEILLFSKGVVGMPKREQ